MKRDYIATHMQTMTSLTLVWIIPFLCVWETPGGYGQLNGLTSYVPLSDKSLDMLFIFDTTDTEMFEQSKLFTVDTLAAADVDAGLVNVGLVTFTSSVFYLHYYLNNGMGKTSLLNAIESLPIASGNVISLFDTFIDVMGDTYGGRLYVSNITVIFVSTYSASDISTALQQLQIVEYDSEVNIIGLQLYNSTDLMSYADHSYIADNVTQLDSFTATTFFTTFTNDCERRPGQTATTTTAVVPLPLAEWSANTRNNLILDISTLSSTIRKRPPPPTAVRRAP